MTLEQQAALLGHIERREIEREGYFTTKFPYHQGRRYFARLSDASHARQCYATWLVTALQRRQVRERQRAS